MWEDIRYGARMLVKRPGFTLIVVFMMALGIGANTAIFSVVNAFLLRPLPYKDSDRLVRVQSQFSSRELGVSYADYLDWREQSSSFEETAFFGSSWLANVNFDGETETLTGTLCTWNLFQALGINPMLGRGFVPDDAQSGSPPVAILSNEIWQRRFGSDPGVCGKKIDVGGDLLTIIAIMPPGFKYPSQSELFVPAERWFNPENRRVRIDKVVARLKPGVTIKQAQSEMDRIAQGLAEKYPDTNKDVGASLVSERELWVGDIRPSLLLLLGACGFVLLIACANIANLLLARTREREREVAIRLALGAGRLRLVRQLLTENILLASLGGGLGLLLALWGIEALVVAMPVELPSWVAIDIDQRVLLFTLAISIFTGLTFGLAPAVQATRLDLNESLKEGSKSVASSQSRTRRLLVVSEVALALLLLIGAGLMMRSFLHLKGLDPGFRAENVLIVETNFSMRRELTREKTSAIFDQVIGRIRALPGVVAVGANSDLPFVGQEPWDRVDFTAEGQSFDEYKSNPLANWQSVNPDYFRAMGIPLVKGRLFNEQDATNGSAPTIISRRMAESLWPGQDPIGKRVKGGEPDSDSEWGVIVGVVGDVRHTGLLAGAGFDMYGSYQSPWKEMHLVIRCERDPMSIASSVRKELWNTSSDLGINKVMPLEGLVTDSVWQPRLWGVLFGIFSVIALILASAGIYGVISYTVSRRTHEIGIRMALGAQRQDVLKLILKESAMLVFAGMVVGLTGAFTLSRAIASQLYGVSATDPVTFAAISLLLAGVAMLAGYIPARRATRVDPMVALRYE